MASTKETIVLLGDELIRKKGYNAFSYADISRQLNVKNAAIHYHYPSKPDLAEAVVDFHTDSFNRFTEKASSKNEADQIKMFLNFYASIQLSGKLCVIGSFASDWNSMEEEVQGKVTEFTNTVLGWITETLRMGKEKNLLSFTSPANIEAMKILTNMCAGTQLARITGSNDFTEIKNSILKEIIH
ncbi:MAG: TetR/AcrR family transcriptional regulator [Balneolaceae bacterium]|nr:TetR/AcrR family transcriptional regulator [Balneolaceae bacterium]MBO6545225.1 TetR/AcrR family transcriptional regulator [Balneolaceae bacterium]MBO6646621.1 TetR/AcrR family transcriptional regulator [Balneolaceae bacterium]